jgi:hypothetical protein
LNSPRDPKSFDNCGSQSSKTDIFDEAKLIPVKKDGEGFGASRTDSGPKINSPDGSFLGKKTVNGIEVLRHSDDKRNVGTLETQSVSKRVKRQGGSGEEIRFAYFDARAFSTRDIEGAEKVIYWRHALDGRRNAVGMVGSCLFGHKGIDGLSIVQLLEKIKAKHNVDPYLHYPAASMYGVFLKRTEYPFEGFNPITGQTVSTTRTRIEARSLDWAHTPIADRINIISSRLWEASDPKSLETIDI